MRSIPLQRALLPLVDEADREDAKEDHHRPKAEEAHFLKATAMETGKTPTRSKMMNRMETR